MEEIESLGKQELRELESRLGILIGHLLQWDYQPEKPSKSWRVTIREQRRIVQKLISQNPSLKPHLPDVITDAYESGKDLVVADTPLEYENLPENCPYTIEQIFDPSFPINLMDTFTKTPL